MVCDSDEHDEEGHITESFEMRNHMVKKRLNRLALLEAERIMPTLHGQGDTVVACWGSTYGAVKEALELLGNDDTVLVHFSQVYPLFEPMLKPLRDAKTLVVVEQNATGQFARLLRGHYGITADHRVLDASGLPMSVEQIAEAIEACLGGAS